MISLSEADLAPLLLGLRELDAQQQRTPCQVPVVAHLWTSEEPGEREAAAHRCSPCALLTQCAGYARATKAQFHVWAGTDLTRTTIRGDR